MGHSFVCDHCGEQVSIDASECPFCHHLFKAVRCSKCSYSGQPKEFKTGCPVCFYFIENEKSGSPQKNRKGISRKKNKGQSSAEVLGLRTLFVLLLGVFFVLGLIYYFFVR